MANGKGTESPGIKTFNYIRENASEAFLKVVPSATKDNITAISDILFNDAYQPQLNEFVSNLINRIGLTIIRNKSVYNNPLSIFKKGSVPLGTDIQDVFENPAQAEAYELSNTAMAKILTITDPDTHVAYYRRNRRDLYTKTITQEGLKGAFVSWNKFEQYIQEITNSLYSGNYIDEFKYTKDLIDGAYDNDKVIIQEVSAVNNEATAKAFVKAVKKAYSKMKFPSTEYNAYSKFSGAKGKITTWTNEDRICLIATSDVLAEVDVEVLASAFNIDNAKLMGRIYEVDKFENPEIQAVLCDESWLQIYDNKLSFTDFFNARTITWNEYLHAWNTFAICPFANAICFATSSPKPATNITLDEDSYTITDLDTTQNATATLTPNNATSDVTFTSSDERVFIISNVSNNVATLKGIQEGTATLVARTDNGKVASANVSVTLE